MGLTSRIRLTVTYNGSGFHGFAANAGVRTVEGDLVAALTLVLHQSEPVDLVCAGRTDRGVHATGQVVSFDAPANTDLVDLVRRMNKRLTSEISVRDPLVMPHDFDARFSAKRRRYRYLVWNRVEPDPFMTGRAWHVEKPLQLAQLRLGCDPFIGLHDFSAFCRQGVRSDGQPATMLRRIHEASWHREGAHLYVFEIEAKAFCHQMVRSVVGTLVEVGYGRRRAGEILGMINSRDRSLAGDLAPPHGLYLDTVSY